MPTHWHHARSDPSGFGGVRGVVWCACSRGGTTSLPGGVMLSRRAERSRGRSYRLSRAELRCRGRGTWPSRPRITTRGGRKRTRRTPISTHGPRRFGGLGSLSVSTRIRALAKTAGRVGSSGDTPRTLRGQGTNSVESRCDLREALSRGGGRPFGKRADRSRRALGARCQTALRAPRE